MKHKSAATIRRIEANDYAGWNQLYAAYAAFYAVAQTQTMRDQVWQWIHQSAPLVYALVAVDEKGHLVGILHYRTFVRPLAASMGAYVDDIFVMPEARGQGIAAQLIKAVVAIGQRSEWSVIRWMTAEDNQRARACYDRIAEHTHWQTYQIPL
ncbi:MAG: GNAT family N-acetyltransferase [Methylophilus sp.]|uniref:GNAT family N-acetyltransferase n=1 Tax=Methylophilus sp. TaxID=29541 RepID=UPI003FA0E599